MADVLAWLVTSRYIHHPTDMDLFFWPSAKIALGGHPLLVYSDTSHRPYPNANGPLSLLPLTLAAALSRPLGWLDDMSLRGTLTLGLFSVFSLGIAGLGLRIVERLRGAGLRTRWRALVAIAFLAVPPLWQGVAGYGHVEQPIELLLVLLAIHWLRERPVGAGIALGLAILTRTTAILYVFPLATALLATRGLRPALLLVVSAGSTATAGIAPFLVADRNNVIYSLVTFRGQLTIYGGSFWMLSAGTPWAAFGERWDGVLTVGAATALSLASIWRLRAGRPTILLGLLAAVAACFPMLAKTVWAYYFLDPCVLALVWWLGRPGSAFNWRGIVPWLLAGVGILTDFSSTLQITDHNRLLTSIAITLITLASTGLLMAPDGRARLGGKPSPAHT